MAADGAPANPCSLTVSGDMAVIAAGGHAPLSPEPARNDSCRNAASVNFPETPVILDNSGPGAGHNQRIIQWRAYR